MKVFANGINFHCEVEDSATGRPWITLSHALANNLSLWDDVVDALKGRFRIFRYDQRGHGKTEAVPGPYSFPMLMDDVLALWNSLGIPRSHWVGLSIGGMIGYGLGISHPSKLISLVACDSRPDAPPDYAAYFQSRIDKAREKGMEGVVESTIERWFTPQTVTENPPYLDKVRRMIRSTDPVGHEGCCEALKTLSFGPRLSEIRLPTMIIGGAKDKGAPPDILADAAAKIVDARHRAVPDAGHICVLENPLFFLSELQQFLSEFESDARSKAARQ
ncbi:alpha/beta fold hydrolase [Bradyrhizobium vignae]|uniref:Alpha/beta hydrolase fold n=1 Tax=Bradyrhizobium vignae TaxID=1549949 RepID=A0A2U3PUX1_9BRAD|nr:alpha/beta fold hydrolase [Bradyrhizobium vignae]SPP92924.1 Alpha/beta hydrolase fold [Bradyrhizobium vignae]